MDAILDISKCSLMPKWHHSDFSRAIYALPESTKKKIEIEFQVLLKFAQILLDYLGYGELMLSKKRKGEKTKRKVSILRKCHHHISHTNLRHRSQTYTIKPVLNGHLKIDKTKVLMENGSLVQAESIAECSAWSILQYF